MKFQKPEVAEETGPGLSEARSARTQVAEVGAGGRAWRGCGARTGAGGLYSIRLEVRPRGVGP